MKGKNKKAEEDPSNPRDKTKRVAKEKRKREKAIKRLWSKQDERPVWSKYGIVRVCNKILSKTYEMGRAKLASLGAVELNHYSCRGKRSESRRGCQE
ncbi:unnamed protein product [Dovyalis caffra]|uniref:Ribosomal protein S14 n=1 Tax=Dovyalis caffra TaxID=77055 RepID=A0AAV1SLM7_9ROSI|nr:unnamed protein product [Dovyalis caffra]